MAKKALVVDNDFFFVEFLTELLEKKDFEVTKAYDGKEGISKMEGGVFNVLFVDLIMPKIDGIQLIKFARTRFAKKDLFIIAVSGTLVEQLEDVSGIGADCCVVKGPLDEMTVRLNDILDKVERKEMPVADGYGVIEPGHMYPRQATSELVDELKFQKAILESIGVGILVVDKDARVMSANTVAVKVFGRDYEDILNMRITSLFPQEDRGRLVEALKNVARNPGTLNHSVYLTCGFERVKVVVSLLRMGTDLDGWVLAMEDINP